MPSISNSRCSTRYIARLLIVTGSVALLAACGGQKNSQEPVDLYGQKVALDQELADRVPSDWKNGITVPVKVLQPNAYVDENGETVGLQPDLVKAMGSKWGIPVTMETVGFDGHIPGVMAGKYAFTASTGDHEQRRAVLDMVDYVQAGVAWLAPIDSEIQSVDDICGHKIGVIKGTDQEQEAEELVESCNSRGVSGTSVDGFSNTMITVPLEADRIDIAYDSVSFMMYAAKNMSDQFKLVGEPDYVAAIAFGVKKGEAEKVDLLRDTVQSLMDDGSYAKVLDHWGQTSLSFDRPYVNSEGMPKQ